MVKAFDRFPTFYPKNSARHRLPLFTEKLSLEVAAAYDRCCLNTLIFAVSKT